MSTAEFKHIRLQYVDGIVVIKMMSKDVQGPDMATEFLAELMTVAQQEDTRPILLNLRGATHFSSMGYAAPSSWSKSPRNASGPCGFATCTRTPASGPISLGFRWSSRFTTPNSRRPGVRAGVSVPP